MTILRFLRRPLGAALITAAALAAFLFNAQPVKRALAQGIQHLATLTGTEELLVNFPCTVSCSVSPAVLATYLRTSSLLFSQTVSSGDAATTGEQTLASYSLPANSLSVGSRLAIRAVFQTGADGNTKTMKVYFGASSFSSGAVTGSGKITTIFVNVAQTGTATQTISAEIQNDATPAANALTLGTDTAASPIIIKATGTNGTAVFNEIYLADFYVWRFGN
jgi:hypothetical protein